jgi:hypothetical protein
MVKFSAPHPGKDRFHTGRDCDNLIILVQKEWVVSESIIADPDCSAIRRNPGGDERAIEVRQARRSHRVGRDRVDHISG